MIFDCLTFSSLMAFLGCDACVATTLSTVSDQTLDTARYGYLDDTLISTTLSGVATALTVPSNARAEEQQSYQDTQSYVESLEAKDIDEVLISLGYNIDTTSTKVENCKVKRLVKKM